MKFAVFAALFAVAQAADEVAMPFSLDQMAVMVALSGKARFTKYMELLKAKWFATWKAIDANKDKTESDYDTAFWTAYAAASNKWATDIVTAADLGTDTAKIDALWNELWEQRLKLDVQYEATKNLEKTIVDDLVAENPKIKEAVDKMSADDKTSFTTAVKSMSSDLVSAQQEKAEAVMADKAAAGIFKLDAAAQKAYDDAQAKLREAAEAKATEQAEAAVTALKEELSDPNYKAPTEAVSFADKIKAMEEANKKRVQQEKDMAAQAKAQMADLQTLGFFDSTKTDADKEKLLAEKKAAAEAAQEAANPTPGKKGWPCLSVVKQAKTDELDEVRVRAGCNEGLCCGTAWSAGIDEDDTLNDGVSFHEANVEAKQRLEVCGKALMDNADGDKETVDGVEKVVQVPNNVYEHTITVNNVPKQIKLQFACIEGASRFVASAAAVVAATYLAM